MSDLPAPAPSQLPAKVTEDEAVTALRTLLGHPAMAQNVGLVVLSKMALDERVPARERLRAGECLLQAKLKAVELYGALTGSKEQHLHALGLSQGPQEVHVEQHNTKIEIVRQDARDWRSAEAP